MWSVGDGNMARLGYDPRIGSDGDHRLSLVIVDSLRDQGYVMLAQAGDAEKYYSFLTGFHTSR